MPKVPGYLNVSLASLSALVLTGMLGSSAVAADDAMAKPPLTDRQKIVHVLNRLGFGPRPGDVERVEKLGLDAYVRQQLHPEAIPDPVADTSIQSLEMLRRSSGELMDAYVGDIKRFIQMQSAAGNAEDMKLRYGIDAGTTKPAVGVGMDKPAPRHAEKPPGMGVGKLNEALDHESVRAVGELQQAKVLRAVLSERQLNEVLVDFWTNHFNIDVKKGPCQALKPADDRDVIRAHALGKFRDLLAASARSPAMIHYLDNQENSVARERSALEKKLFEIYAGYKLGLKSKGLISDKEGPNENYGREILELHTLGVDGGYTQQDVQEVARCFSGWGLGGLNGKFEFKGNRHDSGKKVVLGHTIAAGGGISDGEQVLDILASHPSTAKFVSRKLCQRFVADEPPAELVGRVADVFTGSNGDLRKVVEAIVTSPEFYSPAAYRAKIKSPFEYAVSAVRATGGQVVDLPAPWTNLRFVMEGAGTLGYGEDKLSTQTHKSLNWSIHEMGEPLFAFAAPTGYPEISSKWVSPGALIDRLNFALGLTQQEISDVRMDPKKLAANADADQPEKVLDVLSQVLLQGELTPATRATLSKTAVPTEEGKTVDVARLTALILGSPEFQRR